MPAPLVGNIILETSPGQVSSPFVLTGGAGLYYAVEIAFPNNPTDASLTWVNVTAYCRGFSYQRGRQHELNAIQAGTGAIQLKNLNRILEPAYSGSPYYPNVVPIKPVRVWMNLNGTQYLCFTHFIERWPQKRKGATYAEQQITTVDGFELLSAAQLPGAAYPQELSGARITRALNAVGWPAAMRNISAGQSQVQSYTFASTDNVGALSHIQSVAQAESGLFFIAGNGYATFLDRNTLQASPYSVSQAVISDRSADVPGIATLGYSDIVPSYDKDLIVNDWQVTPTASGSYPGLVLQEAIDSTSEAQYFVRTQAQTVPLTTNTDALALAQYLAFSYRQPLLRHDSITVRPGKTAAAWLQVLSREIGDRITVIEHPPGGGTPYDADERIQYISVTVGDDVADATCQWATYPASVGTFLILDDANLGKLDAGNALAY